MCEIPNTSKIVLGFKTEFIFYAFFNFIWEPSSAQEKKVVLLDFEKMKL